MKSYTIVYFMDYGKSLGGACMTLLHQIALMKKSGHRVAVFFSDYYGGGMSDEYQKICFQFGIQYEWAAYQISSHPEDIDVVCIDRNYETLRDRVAAYHPDILHSVQLNPCAEFIGRELQIPHIMNIYPLMDDFFRIKYVDIFPHYHICDSWYWAKKWNQYLHTDFTCIRTAAYEAAGRPRKFEESAIKFICVGGICKGKNQLSVIRAFHKVLQYGIKGKLTLCGYADEEYYNECKQYIEDNGLENEIIFKGFCTDMSAEYADSDILICGSTRESYPNVISEAMANGLVIISTPVAGVPEIIVDRKNGYLADDYSVNALFEKIIQVSEDIVNGCMGRILDNVQNTYRENHSPQAVSGQLMHYYQYVSDDYKEWAIQKDDIVRIDGFRTVFHDFIQTFQKNEAGFAYPQEVSKKLWYLYHISAFVNEAVRRGKEFYVWGTGKFGIVVNEMVKVFFPLVSIRGFIDSKKSGKFCHYTIYHPNRIVPQKNAVVLIAAVNGQSEMIQTMESANKIFNKDYFILSERAW